MESPKPSRKRTRTRDSTPSSVIEDGAEDPIFSYYKDRALHTEKLVKIQSETNSQLDAEENSCEISPVSWNNINGDDGKCRVLTGFSCCHFLELLNLCGDSIPINIGRGRKSRISIADKFIVLLCYLKHYETQAKIAVTFNISKPQINRIINITAWSVFPVLYETLVTNIDRKIIINDVDFPDTQFIMDTTIQKIWTPTGSYQEKKQYYSGKHKLYGLKSLTLHTRNGLAVECWTGYPGAMHDLNIAIKNVESIKPILLKHDAMLEESWAVFVDKGFIGLDRHIKIITPNKKQPNSELTIIQTEYNRKVASCRIICERWYGRLKTSYRIIAGDYHNNREDYEIYFKLCTALTNFGILKHPL